MASSGQAFNSLSYGMEGMELSSNLLLLPSCLLWVPILVYSPGKERLEAGTRRFAAMWRCGACPVADGSLCSSGGSTKMKKNCFCKSSAALAQIGTSCQQSQCLVSGACGSGRWQLPFLPAPHPSRPRRGVDG